MKFLRKIRKAGKDQHVVPAQLRTLDHVLESAFCDQKYADARLAAIRAALAEQAEPTPARAPARIPLARTAQGQHPVLEISSPEPAPVPTAPEPRRGYFRLIPGLDAVVQCMRRSAAVRWGGVLALCCVGVLFVVVVQGIRISAPQDASGLMPPTPSVTAPPASSDSDGQYAITFDVLGLDYPSLTVPGFGDLDPHQKRMLRLASGYYWIRSPTGSNVGFSVNNAGQVDYDPNLDSILFGRGSARLSIQGLAITVDTGPARTLQLLPGPNEVDVSGSSVQFTVSPDGLVDYDHALDGKLSGRGTARLTIRTAREG